MIGFFYTNNKTNCKPRIGKAFSCLVALLAFGMVTPAFGQTTNPAPYCNVDDDCNGGFDPQINSVSIGNFTNNSGGCNNSGDVTFFNNLGPVKLEVGKTYTASIEVDGTFFDKGSGIWIDFNKNQQFEPSEYFGPGGTAGAGIQTQTFQVTIPAGAACGKTRMRVKVDEDNVPQGQPCAMVDFDGEVEDYIVSLQPGTKGQDDLAIGSIISPTKDQNEYGLESLKFTIVNSSDQLIPANTTIPFEVQTSIGGTETINYTLPRDLGSCGADTVNFGSISLGCSGIHNIKITNKWNSDVNGSNDSTALQILNPSGTKVIASEDFESGSVGPGWRVSGGSVNTNDGPRGSFHWSGFDDGEKYVEVTVNLNNLNLPRLTVWSKDLGFPEVEDGDGLFISTNGGQNFTRVSTLRIDRQQPTLNGVYLKFTFNLLNLLQENNLQVPPNGKIIIRFGQEDTIGGEGVAYDDIKIADFPVAKPKPVPANTCFNISSDSIYDGAPVNLISNVNNPAIGTEWIIDGKTVATNESLITETFNRSPGKTQTTISFVTAGCFGFDTCTRTYDILNQKNPPVSNFVADKNVVVALQDTVAFTNLSNNGPTTSEWRISPSLDGVNPTFVWSNNTNTPRFTFNPSALFVSPGVYDVTLITSNSQGFDTLTRDNYIRVRQYHDICQETSSSDTVGTLRDREGPYPKNANCSYTIQGCAKRINLELDQLNLKDGSAFLRIYDGESSQGKPLWDVDKFGSNGLTGNLADTVSTNFVANSGAVFVEFTSGQDPKGSGFQISWKGDNWTLDPLITGMSGDTGRACLNQDAAFMANSNATGNRFEWYFNNPINGNPDGTGQMFSNPVMDQDPDTVKLVTKHCSRIDTQRKIITPVVSNRNPDVNFTASRRIGTVNDVIQLRETTDSICIAGRRWGIVPNTFEFVNNSSEESKVADIKFNEEGVYTVSLFDTTNGGNVGSKTKTGFITILDYCTPGVLNLNNDIGVNEFSLEEIDHTSRIGKQAYADFTDTTNPATLERGGTFEFSIERFSNANPMNLKIWIDFNRDGDFGEPNEMVYRNRSIPGQQLTDSFTVPRSANFNVYRLRLGTNLAKLSNEGCGTNKFGEFEDYRVRVIPDSKAPSILTKGGDTATLNACNSVSKYIRSAFAQDIVDGKITDLNVSGTVDSSSAGFYNVDYSITDNNGNDTSFTQIFEILADQTKPSFSLAGPDTFILGVNKPYSDPGVMKLMDNCAGVSSLNVDSSNLNNGQLGNYQISFTAMDSLGNQMTKTRVVKVVDTVKPNAVIKGANPDTAMLGKAYNDQGVTNLNDNFYSTASLDVSTVGKVDGFNPGTYRLRYMVEDGSGNVTKLMRTVVVTDQTSPEFVGSFSDTVMLPVDKKLNVLNQVQVRDNNSQAMVVDTAGSFIQQFPDLVGSILGTYNLQLEAKDMNGNVSKLNLTIKVVDNIAPDISLKGPKFLSLERFDTTPYEAVDSVEVTDNYYKPSRLEVNVTGNYVTDYLDTFGRGAYTLTYTVTDPSGNSASISRSIKTIEATGLKDVKEGGTGITAYPNPTKGRLTIEILGKGVKNGRLAILNIAGQKVRDVREGEISGDYQVNLNGVDAGVYIIQLRTSEKTMQKRIVVSE